MPFINNPTAGDVHVNRPLTNFSQSWMQEQRDFIWPTAIPLIGSQHQSDLYWDYDRDDFYRDNAQERANGTESAGAGFNVSTAMFNCRVFALHDDITDRDRANQDRPINLDRDAVDFLMEQQNIRAERLFVASIFSATPWTGGSNVAINWANEDTSGGQTPTDPIVDVRTARRTIKQNTGKDPNRLILARDQWDRLVDNDHILERIEGGATTREPAMVMRELVAQIMELDSIDVMNAVYTSSVRGASTATRAFIGTAGGALLAHLPARVGRRTPSAAVRFAWTGLHGNTGNGIRVKKFRLERNSADRVEAEFAFDFRVTSGDLGYWFAQAS